ncbi:uncharacterized protein LOC115778162 [Archocentrus centrarchus]|uniref:uncharacterized protein LOC115778162 n=1 Tax=Archocentrus centrarchus TaxID=63155 RepID=UPI0011E9CA39|nr:uncharacterized protein LOC115778162 [Archocentrus centrarchus]
MRNSGKKITTVRYYLHNIAQFLEYLLNVRPKHMKLTLEQNREILQLVEKARKETSRDIVVHQNRVKRKKMDQIPDAETIRTCLRVAPAAISDLLDKLEADSRQTTTRYLLYGYLTAYWACMSGHKPSVFINMKEDEVVASEKKLTDQGVLIRVADHKTTVRFGEANLAVTRAEFDWIRRLLAIKRTVRSRNRYVLFTLGKHPFKNVNRYLQMAWDKMGLKGEINFTLIRTALADGAKSLLPEEQRRKVSFSMCHDTRTTDRFYTRNPNLSDAMEVRKTMERMLSGLDLMPTPSRAVALDPKRLTPSEPEDAPGPSDTALPGPSGTAQAKRGGKKTAKRQRETTASSNSNSRLKRTPSPLKTANLRVQRTREASQKVKRVLRKHTGL